MIVRRLCEGERKHVLDFYLALGEEDRRLRFFSPVGDSAITRYVTTLNFNHDIVLGAFDGNAQLLGVLELSRSADEVELAVAVGENYRGRGVGQALVERAWAEMRSSGAHSVVLVTLSENTSMRRLADRLGMKTRFVDGDLESRRPIPPASSQETWESASQELLSTAWWATAKSLRLVREFNLNTSELSSRLYPVTHAIQNH